MRLSLLLAILASTAALAAILVVHVFRERRLPHRRRLMRVLLPALGMLVGALYADVLYAGPYREQLAVAARLLESVALGALIAMMLASRMPRVERPQRQRTILAIGAHPDDIEFGCGATLLRLREEGAETYGLVLSGGERGHHAGAAGRVRLAEAGAAARLIALCDLVVHDLPDTLLHEHKPRVRKIIEDAVLRWRPDVIFTHNAHDVHTDHQTVFDATREAARGACTILCYETPNTPPGFKPGYFVEVANYLEGKIAALACHRTQMRKSYAASSVVRAIAAFRGNQARVSLAEGFEVMRVLEKECKP